MPILSTVVASDRGRVLVLGLVVLAATDLAATAHQRAMLVDKLSTSKPGQLSGHPVGIDVHCVGVARSAEQCRRSVTCSCRGRRRRELASGKCTVVDKVSKLKIRFAADDFQLIVRGGAIGEV